MAKNADVTGPARRFEDLIVWRKAHQMVLDVYRWTARFPREETYGMSSQLRRSAVSVPANIVEGFRRRGRADKSRFLNIAQASLEESRYYFILGRDLGYGDPSALMSSAEEVSKLLDAYSRSILSS